MTDLMDPAREVRENRRAAAKERSMVEIDRKRLATPPATLAEAALMSPNPYGPLSPAEFQAAVDAPYGGAAKILRKADPLWGRAKGEQFKWRVRVEQTVIMAGFVTVLASSEDEAKRVAASQDVTCDEYVMTTDTSCIDAEPAHEPGQGRP